MIILIKEIGNSWQATVRVGANWVVGEFCPAPEAAMKDAQAKFSAPRISTDLGDFLK